MIRKALALGAFASMIAACALQTQTDSSLETASAALTVQSFPHWANMQMANPDGSLSPFCLRWNTDGGAWWSRAYCDPNDPFQAFSYREQVVGNYNQCLANITGMPYFVACNAADGRQLWHLITDYVNMQDSNGNWITNKIPTIENSHGVMGTCAGTRGAVNVCFVPQNENYSPSQGVSFIEIPRSNLIKYQFSGMRTRCLDNGGPNFAQGRQMQTWTCNGLGAQNFQWDVWHNGQIKDLGTGMCLDILGFNSANGAIVDEWPCNGYANQSWTVTSDGQVVSNYNNKCLEIANWNTADGAPVQMWDCTGGFNQHWDHVQ